MNLLELATYPDPCLRIRTRAVGEFTGELENTIRGMTEIMYLNKGIGLAATQVGLGSSLFIADVGEGLKVFVNPEIIERSDEKDRMEEGCLSLAGVGVNVARPENVKIKARDIHGEFFFETFDGLMAKVVQHEMDHLEGKLIIDYLNPALRFWNAWKLARQKRSLETQRMRA
ncbi:MAG: peptide deformylase [Candidatus Omnitrophica bacterium]|nr:peptide deformylase [Candidatus Omnitrophota bacterium]